MARKTREAFPVAAPQDPAASAETPRPGLRRAPMFAKGAASLDTARKSAAAEERMFRNVSVGLIDPSPIRDRIDLTEDLDVLKQSLANDGQQIPILVRPKPGTDRYEIVAGRRRLQASLELGWTSIQAFVRQMSDEEAFVAQGIENNARLETSFIERARTILSALDAGFSQVQVEKFLGVDQSLVSRMRSIYQGLGEDLILAIGPARGVGRRKWERLLSAAQSIGKPTSDIAKEVPNLPDSVDRFDGLVAKLEQKLAPPPAPAPTPERAKRAEAQKDAPKGRVTSTIKGRRMTVSLDASVSPEFLTFLESRMTDLLDTFEADAPAST